MKTITLASIYAKADNTSPVLLEDIDEIRYRFCNQNSYRGQYISFRDDSDIFVKVVKGPRKGTIGCVASITPEQVKDGLFDPVKASVEYYISDKDPTTQWIGSDAYRNVNAAHVEFMTGYTGKLVYVNNAKKPQARVGYKHFNMLGKEIEVGQFVVFKHDYDLGFGTVKESKRTTVRIEFAGKEYSTNDTANVIAINDEELKEELMMKVLTGEMESLWSMPKGRTDKFKLKQEKV